MQNKEIKTVTIYCGARTGNDPVFMNLARELGSGLGRMGITAMYGASSSGLMGEFARNFLAGGAGTLKGVLPEYFMAGNKPEALGAGLHFVTTKTLAERKYLLMREADAFIALPGGMGTFDEIYNTLEESLGAYIKGGRNDAFKPIYLMNHDGFFDGTRAQIQTAINAGFISARAMDCLVFIPTAKEALDRLSKS